MARDIPNVQRRGDAYFARIAVPAELRPIVGTSELRERVGTTHREALARSRVVLAGFQARLDEARAKVQAEAESNLAEIARGFFARELGRDDDERATGHSADPLTTRSRAFYAVNLRRLVAGKLGDDEAEALIGWAADEVAANGAAPDVPRRDLLKSLAGVQLEALDAFDRRDRLEPDPEPKHRLLVEAPAPAPIMLPAVLVGARGQMRVLSDQSVRPLSSLIADIHAERRIAPATVGEQKVAVRMLEEFLGGARPVCEINRADMIAFKKALTRTPANYALRFPNLTLPEAIEANGKRAEPFPTLNATTINKKWLAHLKALLKWCVLNDVLPDNPADGVKVDEGNGAQEASRAPFTPDDLKRLFGPHFAPDGRFGTNQWALLIALFTGARSSSEIARIKLDDVHTEQGVLVFHLVEASKNARSKRIVPVHRRLIELGLERYIAELRRRGESRLFPDWEPEDKVNRWFLRTYKKAVGIHDPTKVFHSFRHTLKTALARAGVPRDVSDLITGHQDQSVAGIYIHDKHVTMIEAMRDGLNRVDFDAVNWKVLRR